VSKDITTRLETYSSRDIGALGFVDDDQITFYRVPVKRHTRATPFDALRLEKLPRVDIVYTYAGADGALIEAAVAQGAEGVVIAGFPTGTATPLMEDAIRGAVGRGIAVVMTNRGGMGRVMDKKREEARPLIWGDNLTPVKARILLMLALTATRDPAVLQDMFEKY
jgi:L-asparaginase